MSIYALITPGGAELDYSVCNSRLWTQALHYERSGHRPNSPSWSWWDRACRNVGAFRARGRSRLYSDGWRVEEVTVVRRQQLRLLEGVA